MDDGTTGEAHRPEGWWAWPLLYGVGAYVAGYLPALHTLPWWVLPAVAVVAALGGRSICRHVLPWDIYGDLSHEIGYWGLLAGLSAALWLGWLAVTLGRPSANWQIMAIGCGTFTVWWVSVWLRAPGEAARLAGEPDTAQPASGDPFQPYAGILHRAGVTKAQVVAVEHGEAVDLIRVEPTDPLEGQQALTYEGFAAKASPIATEVARHFKREGLRIQAEDVLPMPGEDAAEFLLQITRRRVLTGDMPYEPAVAPQPWCGPLNLGNYETLRSLELTMCHKEQGANHLEVIGAAGSGKGNLLKVLQAKRSESDEGELWLIGTSKLVKSAAVWLRCWLDGRVDRPPIDRVGGEDIYHALEALADALHYMKIVNATTFGNEARRPTRGKGNLELHIDEAGRLLERTEKIEVYDGRLMNAGQIVSEIKQEGRSAGVSVVTANQDNLFDSSGAGGSGAKGKRNTGAAIVLRVNVRHDAAQPLDGLPATVNPVKLRDNQLYLRPNTDEPVVQRGKAWRLEDEQLDAIAVRVSQWRYGLDPAVTSQLRWYGRRWSVNRHPLLAAWCEKEGWPWPGTEAAPDYPQEKAEQDRPKRGAAPPIERPVGGTETARPAGTVSTPGAQPAAQGSDDAMPWTTEDDRILAEMGITLGEPPEDVIPPSGPPGATTEGGLPVLDGNDLRAIGARWVAAERERIDAARGPIPDPLGLVLAILERPGAPEFIPTEVLAVAVRVCQADPAEQDRVKAELRDAEARRRATEQLGMDLYRQTGLNSEQAPRTVDKQRRRGYSRSALMDAAKRLRGSGAA